MATAEPDKTLARVKELVLATCGFCLEMGREHSLLEGLRCRMAARGVPLLEEYHALLMRERGELNALVQLLTVNETYFFREPAHLELATGTLVPELLAQRRHRPLRIVSAGCSTGEEPYSIAIRLWERYGAESQRLFAITGLDIDATAIETARKGVYRKGSFRSTEPGVLKGYFEGAGGEEFRVRDGVRNVVAFEVANLLAAFHPGGMLPPPDLIFYRNVSIYFPQPVQKAVFSKLAGLLTEGGYLIVGATETIAHDLGILSLVERDGLFFYRKSPGLRFEDRRRLARNPAVAAQPSAQAHRAAEPRHPAPGSAPSATRGAAAPPKAGFDAALELARRGKAGEALSLLDAVLAQDPSFTKALTLKGSLLVSAARFDEACAICEGVLARDPLCLEAYLMLGIAARHRGDDEAGARRFREAIYLDSSCWLAHFYSAEIHFARGDGKRARTGYEAALRILEKGSLREQGQAFFPLTFNAEEFMVICRHKVSLLKGNG